MSVSIHCFEGLEIRKCICDPGGLFACCKRNKSSTRRGSNAPNRVYRFPESSAEICIVNSPQEDVQSLAFTSENEEYDFVTVDTNKKIISLIGDRLQPLNRDVPVRGKSIFEIFSSNVSSVISPLLDNGLFGKSAQIHTIYLGHPMTMFVYPLKNESGHVVGAFVIYKPTNYNITNVHRLLSRIDSTSI